MGSSKNLDTAKAEFKAAWEALKARTTPEQLVADLKGNEHPGRRVNAERSGALLLLCGGPSAQTADREDWGMMTDDERNNLERMLQHVDDGSRNLAHMLKLLTELRSVVMDNRPDHALLLAEEVYAAFDSLPAELRRMLDEKFQRMEAGP